MGQKVHPTGIRLGMDHIKSDYLIRDLIKKKLKDASVSKIGIERPAKKANITIHTARPGIVIGKKGEDIEKLRAEVAKLIGMNISDVRINISEVRKPELDAQLVAEGIAQQLERRVMFRRAMKRAVTNTMRVGAEGIKVQSEGWRSFERCGNRSFGVVPRGSCTAAHIARGYRLRICGGADNVRRYRRQGLDFQGRSF